MGKNRPVMRFFLPGHKNGRPGAIANRKELNSAPVAPTSAHTESIFSVVFEIFVNVANHEHLNFVPPKAGGRMQPVVV
ncbi:MAG: hypothetical protein ACLQAH_08640 [Limisphaerales bacterium]